MKGLKGLRVKGLKRFRLKGLKGFGLQGFLSSHVTFSLTSLRGL